jgi:predicted DNA binding CopG/RHH family protein
MEDTKKIKYTLRLPFSLYAKIKAQAKAANCLSVQQYLVDLLEKESESTPDVQR